jgi:hypothetical protein
VTPDQARSAAYAQFLTDWAGRTLVQLEGREGTNQPVLGQPWVRVAFRHLGGGQYTMGDQNQRVFRRVASVFVQVFTPSVTGMGSGATLAQAARAIFEGRRVSAIDFNDGQVTELPLSSGDREYQTNVEVRGTYDETK